MLLCGSTSLSTAWWISSRRCERLGPMSPGYNFWPLFIKMKYRRCKYISPHYTYHHTLQVWSSPNLSTIWNFCFKISKLCTHVIMKSMTRIASTIQTYTILSEDLHFQTWPFTCSHNCYIVNTYFSLCEEILKTINNVWTRVKLNGYWRSRRQCTSEIGL